MAVELFDNEFITSLTADINASQVTIPVAAAASAPLQSAGGQFRILVDAERMLVTANAGTTTWTVTRGIEGTGAATHTANSMVAHILTVGGFLNHHTIHEPGGADAFTLLDDTNMNTTVKDGAPSKYSLRTLGTGSQQAMAGNYNPYPAPHQASHQPGGLDALVNLTDASFAAANKDGLATLASLRTLGTGAQQAASGTDARLSDSRNPLAHAASHRYAGADPLYTMIPTAQSSPYLAHAGDIVLMNGANTVSIPTGQSDNVQIGVVALGSGVPVQCGGTDTINIGGVSSSSTTVTSGTSLTLVFKAGVWYGMVSGGGTGGGGVGGTTTGAALQPTNQSGPYIAAANQLVLMTGNFPVTLLGGPPSGSQVGVYALTAPVTMTVTGSDTIDWSGNSNQRSITVPAGLMYVLQYNAGVWYGAPGVVGGPTTPITPSTMTARAYRNASVTFTGGTWSKVGVDTITFDTSGLVQTANGRFVASVSGYYQVEAQINAGPPAASTNELVAALYVNGAASSVGTSSFANQAGGSVGIACGISDVLRLNAGDYVEIYGLSNATLTFSGGNQFVNFMSMTLLTSVPGALGPTTPARAYRNAAMNVAASWQILPFDTISADPGGNINLATNRYVCPATGWYQVNGEVALITTATAQYVIAAIYKNGSQVSIGTASEASVAGGIALGATVNDLIYCNAGDYLQLGIASSTAGLALAVGSTLNYLSAVQVGNLSATPASTAVARMYRNAAWSIPAGAWTKVPLDTTSYDTSGLASTANSRITAPVSGYYQIEGLVLLPTGSSGTVGVSIYKNGSPMAAPQFLATAGAITQGYPVTDVVQCNAGDYIELYAYSQPGGAIASGVQYCYLSAALLTPLSGTAGPNTAARAYRNAALTPGAGWQTIALDTISNDPGNNFSTGTGRYTCPATGMYQVNGQVQFGTGGGTVGIYKNGAEIVVGGSSGGGSAATVSDAIQCNAGDYLQLAAYGATGALVVARSDSNYLSVSLVGNSMNFVNASGDLAGNYPNPTVQRLNGQVNVPKTAPQSGQVMITDGIGGSSWGNVVNAGTAARMYCNASAALGAGAFTKVPLDTISFDSSGMASVANGRINISVAGYYAVTAEAVATNPGTEMAIVVRKNGTTVAEGNDLIGSVSRGVVLSDVIQCSAGDYLELWVYCTSATTIAGGNSYTNFLSVALETTLPSALGPVTVGRMGKVTPITIVSGTWTKFPFDIINYDPGGNCSLASARYVCPATGYYQVDFAFVTAPGPANTNENGQVQIYKNGVGYSNLVRMTQTGTDGWMGISGSDIIPCNAGDYIELWYLASGAWSTTSANMAVVQVGNQVSTPASTAVARMHRNGAATLTAGANTKLTLDTVDFDTSGMTQLANARIVAPVSGYYQVDAQMDFSFSAGSTFFMAMVYKNGVLSIEGVAVVPGSISGQENSVVSDVMQLNAGDYLELWYLVQGTASINAAQAYRNYLGMTLLTPLSGTAGPQTAARAYRNAALTLTASAWSILPVDTVSFDPGSNVVVASNRYVCPATGYYNFEGTVSTSSTAAGQLLAAGIFKNGTWVTQGAATQSSAANTFSSSVSDTIFCNAGDYLQLGYFCSAALAAGTSSQGTYMSVALVGNSMNFSSASGDLSGRYPNPTVSKLNGAALPAGQGAAGQYLQTNGVGQLSWASQNPSTVSARARRANALGPFTANTWTKVPLDTITFDTSGLVNLGNGRMVASVAGYYEISGQVAVTPASSSSDTIVAAIYVNGTERSRGNRSISIATTIQSVDVGDIIQLNAGDQVELWVQCTTADSLSVAVTTDNYLSMVLLNSIPAATGVTTPARMARLATTAIAASTPTKIPLDTVSYDPGGNCSIVNGRYVVPATGFYQVTGSVFVSATAANQTIEALVYKNGGGPIVGGGVIPSPAAGATGSNVSDVLQLNAGDYLELWAYTSAALSTVGSRPDLNYLSVVQVGNLSATPASTGSARIYRNAAFASTAAAFTKIPFDSVDYDTTGFFDSANNRFKAPVAGVYQVNAQLMFSGMTASQPVQMSTFIYVNGVNKSDGGEVPYTDANGHVRATVSDTLRLNAGDYVEIWSYTTGAYALQVSAYGTGVTSWASMFLLTPLSGTAGPVTAARAFRNAAFTTGAAAFVKIPVDTISFDPGGNISIANARYVAPATGYYQVDGGSMVGGLSPNTTSLQVIPVIYINGARAADGAAGGIADLNGNIRVTVSDVVRLNAGDYVELWIYTNAAYALATGLGSPSNYLSVVMVGNSMNFTQAAGDLSGQYPNPTVAKFNGMTLPTGPGIQGQYLQTNGAGQLQWASGGAATGQKLRTPILDVGVLGQIRAGRQLGISDFAALGLNTPIALWNLNDLTDASGNTHTLTNKGTVPFGTGINGLATTAAVFSGSSGQALYISDIGGADPFRIKNGTVGCWFRVAKQAVVSDLICKWSQTAGQGSWTMLINGANQISWTISTTGSDSPQAVGVSSLADDRWHFAVGTYDGAVQRLYIDGVLEAQNIVGVPIFGGSGAFTIGGRGGDQATVTDPYYGRIDEAFITNDVLSPDQVRALYCAKIAHGYVTIPTSFNLAVRRQKKGALFVAATDFPTAPLRLHNFTNGSLNDEGSNATPLTNNNTALTVSGADGLSTGAYNFVSASSQSLSSTDTGLPSGTTVRSWGMWFKTNSAVSAGIGGWGTETTGDTRLTMGTTGVISSTNVGDTMSGPYVADGLWHFVVVIEDPAAGDGVKRKLYVDGLLASGSTVLSAITLAGANHFRIGSNPDGTFPFQGQIDGVFVCGYALTQDQISTLYAKGNQIMSPSPKNAGDHVEYADATNVYTVFDTLDSQHQVDLIVSG